MSLPSQLPPVNLSELAALCAQAPDGNIVELGTYKGGSAFALHSVARGRPLHLFDTFTGLPEKTEQLDIFGIGAFGDVTESNLQALKEHLPNATFHVGFFPATMPAELSSIAFAHIDCDQYASCKAAIELWWPRMVPGGIMAWDDFGFTGIRRAFDEYFHNTDKLKYTDHRIPYMVKEAT